MSKERDDAIREVAEAAHAVRRGCDAGDDCWCSMRDQQHSDACKRMLAALDALRSLKGPSPSPERSAAEAWARNAFGDEAVDRAIEKHPHLTSPSPVSGLTLSVEDVALIREALIFMRDEWWDAVGDSETEPSLGSSRTDAALALLDGRKAGK